MSPHWPWNRPTDDEKARVASLLTESGCPACKAEQDAEQHWIQSYIQETHADESVALQVTHARGFCVPHTRRLMVDPAGPWLLPKVFADLVRQRRADLRANSDPSRDPITTTPTRTSSHTNCHTADHEMGHSPNWDLIAELDMDPHSISPSILEPHAQGPSFSGITQCPICASMRHHADDVVDALVAVLVAVLGEMKSDLSTGPKNLATHNAVWEHATDVESTDRPQPPELAAWPTMGIETQGGKKPQSLEPHLGESIVQAYRDGGGFCLRHVAPLVAGRRHSHKNVTSFIIDVACTRLAHLSVRGTTNGATNATDGSAKGVTGRSELEVWDRASACSDELLVFLAGVDMSSWQRAQEDALVAELSDKYELLQAGQFRHSRGPEQPQSERCIPGPQGVGPAEDDDQAHTATFEFDFSSSLLGFFVDLDRCPVCAAADFTAHQYLCWLTTCDRPRPDRSELALCTTHLNDLHRQDRPTGLALHSICRHWQRCLRSADPAGAVKTQLSLPCAACQAAMHGGSFALRMWVAAGTTPRGQEITRHSLGLCAEHAVSAGPGHEQRAPLN